MAKIKISNKLVGDGEPTFIVGEISPNHNGSVEIAKALIDLAVTYKLDAIKFQKRTIEVVYTKEKLAQYRESPFGDTYEALRKGLEFGIKQYMEIDDYCKKKGIIWFASCWDERSVDFIDQFNPPCYKIASASLTDDNLLKHTRSKHKPIILSTGMSTMDQIKHAVEILGKDELILLQCTATYPCNNNELNLKVIPMLKETFGVPVGFSGHDAGIAPAVMAVALGACVVEKHITLNRAMWGTDHSASLEPRGLELMTRYIRLCPICSGSGIKYVYDSEIPMMKKIRRVG